MPTFAYTGRGARGVINGEIDAPDRTTAVTTANATIR